MASNICEVKRCYRISEITYHGYGICGRHWAKHCDGGHVFLNDPRSFKPSSQKKHKIINSESPADLG
jgi:hypothetical protein